MDVLRTLASTAFTTCTVAAKDRARLDRAQSLTDASCTLVVSVVPLAWTPYSGLGSWLDTLRIRTISQSRLRRPDLRYPIMSPRGSRYVTVSESVPESHDGHGVLGPGP